MNRRIDKRTYITEHVYAADGRNKEPHPNPLPRRGNSIISSHLPLGEIREGYSNIQQNTNYYPYGGMTYISTNQGEQQFKYNGKEYDPMHGLNEYDYGARQYDPAIGKFTTIDPLCEKYYHISPYAYCGGNPVNAVDPNGDTIFVVIGKGKKLLYENQKLYNSDGSLYIGKNRFARKTIEAMHIISQVDIGTRLIDKLSKSKNIFQIKKANTSVFNSRVNDIINYSKTSNEIPDSGGGIISWNTSGTWIFTQIGLKRNPVTDLAHEMFHALDANEGRLSEDEKKFDNLSINEWRACYYENILRAQMGIPLRTYYNIITNDIGEMEPLPPYLLKYDNPWKP